MLMPFLVHELEHNELRTVYPLLKILNEKVMDGEVSKDEAATLIPALREAINSFSLDVKRVPLENEEFAWIYSSLNEFIDENWEGIVDNWEVIDKLMELLRFIPRARQDSLRLQKGNPDEFVGKCIEQHLLLYELVGDFLERFAHAVDKEEKILKKPASEAEYLSNGQVYIVLRNFRDGKYKELFSIFNRTMRNAGSHPGLKSGKIITEEGILFEDLGGKEFFTWKQFVRHAELVNSFGYSAVLIACERGKDWLGGIIGRCG